MRYNSHLLRTTALSTAALVALLDPSGLSIASADAQTQLPGVTVYSTTPQLPGEGAGGTAQPGIGQGLEQPTAASTSVEDPESPARPPVTGDSGEFLRHVNGVDAARMGGHGLDPLIRGLDQNQLGITNDGAYHFGGCPNRMDPPTSHMQLYTYDQVTVKKGFQSVLDGPPAPGGTIQFERVNPTFAPGEAVSTNFKGGTGYRSNGEGKEAFVDMSMGNDWGYIRGYGSYAGANDYRAGGGEEISSSFIQFGGGAIFGRTFDRDSFITLKVEHNNVDDAKFPGSGMDAPMTDDWTYQLKGETDLTWGIIRGVKADIYKTLVDHKMNNFDLRTPPVGTMNMEARTESDTLGGKLVFNGAVGGATFDVGTDYRDVMRDGKRYTGTRLVNYHPTTVQSVLWGDTSIKEYALFGESVIPLAQATKLTAGLRFAHVDASINDPDANAGPGWSPNELFLRAYGISATDQQENNVSGLLRLEQDMGDGLTLFGSASRSVRTADATERYMASFSGSGTQCGGGANMGCTSWVGNPELDPEQHHQIELGATYDGPAFDLKGSAYYNRVTDFIQIYGGQTIFGSGAAAAQASRYYNIDAALAGIEAEATLHLSDVWRLTLAGSYTHGENLTAGTPLAQIAPLSGRFELAYEDAQWLAGLRVNAAAAQNRIDDTSSRQDDGATAAYATLDLFGAYNISQNLQLSGGVTNVLDTRYENHLNRADLLDGTGSKVLEPGRSFYVRAVTKF